MAKADCPKSGASGRRNSKLQEKTEGRRYTFVTSHGCHARVFLSGIHMFVLPDIFGVMQFFVTSRAWVPARGLRE
jgi:hypothetical protein